MTSLAVAGVAVAAGAGLYKSRGSNLISNSSRTNIFLLVRCMVFSPGFAAQIAHRNLRK